MTILFANTPERDLAAPPPRLVLRFALYTGAVLVAAGIAILWLVDRQVASRAQQTVENQARLIAEENLRSHLRASDFAAPVEGKRRAALDGLLRQRILIPGVVAVRLVNRDGTITYAYRHELIGTRAPYAEELAPVFTGRFERRITRTVSWRGERDVKVLQELVPVRPAASSKAIGALELDEDYRAIEVGLGAAHGRLGLILAIAFLVLYASLFPILSRVTRELAARNKRLREQAQERERLLEGERAARAEAEAIQRLLTERNERLRELDQMKDEFVSLVSHQLRTPLTSIRGYIELLLEDGALTDEQARFLGVVDRNSRRLLALVGDLLFLAQIDAGKLELALDEVDLEQLVTHCVETARPLAEARQIELAAHVEAVQPLLGDGARLAQVLDNLVANALKFTPSGGRVEVSLSAPNGRALLEVADTGLGISPGEQSRLFERFFRGSRATEKAIPGTGLGLAIAKAIVERHGGEISIASGEDAGTTVRVELPIQAPRTEGVDARELAA